MRRIDHSSSTTRTHLVKSSGSPVRQHPKALQRPRWSPTTGPAVRPRFRLPLLALGGLLTLATGCYGEDTGPDGGGGTGGSPPELYTCADCNGADAWNCVILDEDGNGIKEATYGGCGSPNGAACQSDAQAYWSNNFPDACPPPYEHICFEILTNACSTYPDSGSCRRWSPASEITLSGGVRQVDASWFDGVVGDPAPLWTCDDAYLAPTSGAGFTVKRASSGEMLYELGLRNGDIPRTINGMRLDNYWDGITAFVELYLQGATSYALVVERSGSNITLVYTLVP